MKKFLLSIIIILVCINSFAQQGLSLERGMIVNSKLYLKEFKAGKFLHYGSPTMFIRTYCLDNKSADVVYTQIYVDKDPYFNEMFSWEIKDSLVVYIRNLVNSDVGAIGCLFVFDNIVLEKIDTSEYMNRHKKELHEFLRKYLSISERIMASHEEDVKRGKIRNVREIPFLSYLFNYYHLAKDNYWELIESKGITYDYVHVSDTTYRFFVRDNKQLTVWEFKRLSSKIRHYDYFDPYLRKTSTQIKTYCYKDGVSFIKLEMPSDEDKRRNYYTSVEKEKVLSTHYDSTWLPQKEKYIPYAIKDTMFFKGHFRTINQNDQIFFVHLQHGGIYYLSEKTIDKIGQVDLTNYKFQLKGDNIFIEDRDNNQLIFFAPVEWMRDDLPKPNVRIITDEKEFKEMFKYVLE